jgi:transmembrane sensor
MLLDEALEQLVHATSGEASVADLQALEQWRARSTAHAEAYRRAIGVWQSLGIAASEGVTEQDRALIEGHAGRPTHGDRSYGRRMFLTGGAMAAVGIAAMVRPPLGLWPSLSELRADYRTDAGQRRTVDLAQGVSIELNTRTSILHRTAQDEMPRIELLSGEVAVQTLTAATQPVTVIADAGRVVVAARSRSNLRYDGEVVRVTCLDGTVNVDGRGRDGTLHAGEQLVYSADNISSVMAVDPAVVAAWQRGWLIFSDEPLTRVLDEVNRYWRGRIFLLNSELGRRHVSARVELVRIDEVIDYVQVALGAHVRTLPGGVVLLS